MNVVDKAHYSHQANTEHKPWIAHAEESRIEPYAQQKNNASATKHHRGVRATQVRFVDNIESFGNTEVGQFKKNQRKRMIMKVIGSKLL